MASSTIAGNIQKAIEGEAGILPGKVFGGSAEDIERAKCKRTTPNQSLQVLSFFICEEKGWKPWWRRHTRLKVIQCRLLANAWPGEHETWTFVILFLVEILRLVTKALSAICER